MQLHYALTESECNACGHHLQWKLDCKDISRPKYVSYHCDNQYLIYIDNVKFDMIEAADRKAPQAELKDEPRAILIAQTKKKEERQAKERTKDKDSKH